MTDDTLSSGVTLPPPKAYFVLFRADGSFGGLFPLRPGTQPVLGRHELRQLPWLEERVERKSDVIPQSATLRSSAFGGPTVPDFQLQEIAAMIRKIQKAMDRCGADGLSSSAGVAELNPTE